ncbi:CRISPR-associated exonuclease, Cas4 family [Marinactinospora thermotolerans DSM 45154]|uniref:CRISPR-associated exonuclease Cas4 n=1 Tax=Marinactinospora thermotolerans DSM 45154 TaxID=1122192 RepID=A0A1T4T7U9_9ACTN|nr:CRISPR-associated protein Cas4 [Marinactinospora thermotolerans]SKA36555.1 CRISPR-associated exonuclease, Cas4 family [Marinactinospora thermotolerans DSM 45154]
MSATPGHRPPWPVTLSALEHYAYCPRQAGLILLEDAFTDDAATVRGTLAHRRVHDPGQESRPRVRTLRALPVWHDELGLTGVCDVVEIHPDGTVLPVEHKSGAYRPGGAADVQVAAQAICLEQRLSTRIDTAAIYAMADRRRHTVAVDAAMRQRVARITEQVREVIKSQALPAPAADARCRRCSMNTGCMPKVLAKRPRFEKLRGALFTPAPETEWDD